MRRSAEEPENEKDDFQDAFRRNLHSYRAPVDPQGWSRLEETLNNDSKEKRRGFITWLAAACAGLLLLSGSIIGYLNLQKNNPEIALETVSKSTEKVITSNPETSENSIANAKVETQEITKPNPTEATSAQKQVAKTKELNTVASNNKPASSTVAPVADQNSIQVAFENAKAKNSKTEQNSLAFNAPINATTSAEKLSSSATKVALDESDNAKQNANESKTEHSETALAKTTSPAFAKAESGAIIAQNTAKNSSLSETKSQDFISEVPKEVSRKALAKNTVAKNGETKTFNFNAQGPEIVAKTNSPAKTSSGISSQKPEFSSVTENSEETLTSGSSKANDELLAVSSEVALDSAEALPNQTKAIALENAETKEGKKNAAGISKWSVAAAYSGLAFEQGLKMGPNYQATNDPNTPTITKAPKYFQAEQEFNENTRELYSSKIQVLAGYQLTPALTLQSGLDLSRYAAETSTTYMIRQKIESIGSGSLAVHSDEMPVLVAVLNGQPYPDSVEEVKRAPTTVKYTYNYIGVPLALQGQLRLKDKFFAYAKAGVTLTWLVKNQILTNSNKNETALASSNDSYQQWHLVLNGGAGLGFKANQHVSFNAGAEGNYFTQGLIKENERLTSSQPYSFGLNAGLTYHF